MGWVINNCAHAFSAAGTLLALIIGRLQTEVHNYGNHIVPTTAHLQNAAYDIITPTYTQ